MAGWPRSFAPADAARHSTSSRRSGRSAGCSTRPATRCGAPARPGGLPGRSKSTAGWRTSSIAATRRPWASRRPAGVRPQVCVLLQADEVTFGYADTPVVHGVSVAVPAGGLVGLIGPNGSGKTTLLRLLAGTRRPSSGRILLDGEPIASLSRAAIARRMAVVPQEAHLAFDYTVLEVALMGRYPHLGAFAIEGPEDVAVAREALAATGAAEFEARLFSTLSGGEKQRVIIAAALTQISAGAR